MTIQRINLIDYFPYKTAREIQEEALNRLSLEWDNYQVFVLQAPTAFGKSAVAKTIMNAVRSSSYLSPTNMLVNQFLEEFPDTASLFRLDSYECETWQNTCAGTRGREGGFCKGCPASRDLVQAKYRRGPGAYNYHTYLAHKIYRDILIIDEAHNLLPHIKDRLALKIWQHDANYPSNAWTYKQFLDWYDSLPPRQRGLKKNRTLLEALVNYRDPEYVVQRTTDMFNGKGTRRGLPEERDCLKLLPVDVQDAPPMFWPREVKKIVLMSATIGKKDIEALGLGSRPVLYIQCASPIPATSRPIVIDPVSVVNRNNINISVELIANRIKELAAHHEGEKGIIHATYQMAGLLRTHLAGDRFLFHDRSTKMEQYERFREASPESGKILIGSGLYEGVDLPGDLGRWQVIAKVPWGSLGNPAVQHLAERDPDWYNWNTLRDVIQACGRICRTPDDFGVTYILDSSIERLLKDADSMVPPWFRDALVFQ